MIPLYTAFTMNLHIALPWMFTSKCQSFFAKESTKQILTNMSHIAQQDDLDPTSAIPALEQPHASDDWVQVLSHAYWVCAASNDTGALIRRPKLTFVVTQSTNVLTSSHQETFF